MSNEKPTDALQRLLAIMATLRDPNDGCPWDVKQTMASLTRYTIEEAYEVADAIAGNEPMAIKDELGDLLFQVVFYAQIAKEQQWFDFDDVAQAISEKLERRHPHVFSTTKRLSDEQLAEQWDAIKAQERATMGNGNSSILDNVPSGLPALTFAQKLQKACAKVGFDWPSVEPVLEKVREEIDEIHAELSQPERSQAAIEAEIGDALFAMVNLARHCNVDADTALRNASHKFSARFRRVEEQASVSGNALDSLNLDEMEALWQQAKLEGL